MARKNILNYPIIPSQSGAAGFNTRSNPTSTLFLDNVSFQVQTTGTLVGALKVWISNQTVDPKQGQTITFWNEAFNVTPTVDLTYPNIVINMNQDSFQWIALEWIPASGAGNINVLMTAKEIGG